LRAIDVVELPLVPILHPERLVLLRWRSGVGRYVIAARSHAFP
jgi:hypothetical protein